jgi:hypothetical protein
VDVYSHHAATYLKRKRCDSDTTRLGCGPAGAPGADAARQQVRCDLLAHTMTVLLQQPGVSPRAGGGLKSRTRAYRRTHQPGAGQVADIHSTHTLAREKSILVTDDGTPEHAAVCESPRDAFRCQW